MHTFSFWMEILRALRGLNVYTYLGEMNPSEEGSIVGVELSYGRGAS
jgi:hypothetical protein